MSLIDCITKLRNEKRLTPKQGEDILRRAKRLENMYRASGKYSEADLAGKASFDALDGMLKDIKIAQYQEALTVERLLERRASAAENAETPNNWQEFKGRKKGASRALMDELLRTDELSNAIDGAAVHKMYDVAERFRSKVGGGIDKTRLFGGKNIDLMRNVVRVLKGEKGSKEATQFAEMIKESLDYLFDRKVRAGINLHRLENFGVPQRWDPSRMRKHGKAAFTRDAMQRLDRNRMVAPDGTPLDDISLNLVLDNIYNKLTGGPIRVLPGEGEFYSRGGGKSLRSSNESSRILHFKQADDWLEMHDKFGSGDIYENIMSDIRRQSKDIAIFERFGPNPQKVFDSLLAEVQLTNQLAKERGEKPVDKKLLGSPEAMWKVLTGAEDGLVNPKVADIMAATRNLQTFTKLGDAALANVADQGYVLIQLQRWGGSYLRYVHKFLKQLRPGNIADRKFAAEMMQGLQWAYSGVTAANRYGDVDAVGKFSRITRAAADFTVRFSGLSSLNRASKNAAALEINATIARNFQSPWVTLDSRIKSGFQERGITEADWNVIRDTTFETQGGARWLDLPTLLVKNPEVNSKITMIIHEIIRKAAPEPDLQTRSIITGGAGKGTFAREARQTFLQFKSFPMTVMIQNLRDLMFDPRLAPTSSRYIEAAKMVIVTSLWGAAIVQLKNINLGKDMQDPTSLDFFLKSIEQGGSLGVLTDGVRLSSQSTKGRMAEMLIGPAPSMAMDMLITLHGGGSALVEGDYNKVGTQMINLLRRNAPGRLWYTKMAYEHLILDQLEEMINPDFYKNWRRYERSLNRETGQEFWWKPGDPTPLRPPEIATKP